MQNPAPQDGRGRTDEPRRVALVTGAARRLGQFIALALARDGWDVGVHYGHSRTEAEQTAERIRALGRRAVCLQARLEDEAAVQTLVPRLTAELGPVTGLVNNAARFVHDDIGSVTAASLQEHLLPNLVAPLLLSQSLYRHLPADTGPGPAAVIVNLLDQKLGNPNPDFLAYTVAKAGLAAATTMLAMALAPRVRVIGVSPGLTLPSYLQDDAAFRAAHARHSPLGASSTPDDIATAVVFAMNNRSITGTVLVVDGGQHLQALPRDVSFVAEGPDAAD